MRTKVHIPYEEMDLYIEIKLRVIRKLSESLLRGKKKETSIQDSFGAWDDDKSAEEIIAEINKARVLGTRSIESFDE